jgi:transcription antitermination protein NusB
VLAKFSLGNDKKKTYIGDEMKRRVAREKAIQALYQIDMRKISLDEALHAVVEEGNEVSGADLAFLRDLVEGVLSHLSEIDEAIANDLRGWNLNRLGYVDRAVLRMAVYELLFAADIPAKVTINEALELSRAFGMEESVKFINGLLDTIAKKRMDKDQVGI